MRFSCRSKTDSNSIIKDQKDCDYIELGNGIGFDQGFIYRRSFQYIAPNNKVVQVPARIYVRIGHLPDNPKRKLRIYLPSYSAHPKKDRLQTSQLSEVSLIEVKSKNKTDLVTGFKITGVRLFLASGYGINLTNTSAASVIENNFLHGFRRASIRLDSMSNNNIVKNNEFYGDGIYSQRLRFLHRAERFKPIGGLLPDFPYMSWKFTQSSNFANIHSEVIINTRNNSFENNSMYDAFNGISIVGRFPKPVTPQESNITTKQVTKNLVVDVINSSLRFEAGDKLTPMVVERNIFVGGMLPLFSMTEYSSPTDFRKNVFLQNKFGRKSLSLDANSVIRIKETKKYFSAKQFRLSGNIFAMPYYNFLTVDSGVSLFHWAFHGNSLIAQKFPIKNSSNLSILRSCRDQTAKKKKDSFECRLDVIKEHFKPNNFKTINYFSGLLETDYSNVKVFDGVLYNWEYPIIQLPVVGNIRLPKGIRPGIQNKMYRNSMRLFLNETRRPVRHFQINKPNLLQTPEFFPGIRQTR